MPKLPTRTGAEEEWAQEFIYIYIYMYTYLYDWSYKDRDEDRLPEAKQVDQREFNAVLEAANVRFRVYIGFKERFPHFLWR